MSIANLRPPAEKRRDGLRRHIAILEGLPPSEESSRRLTNLRQQLAKTERELTGPRRLNVATQREVVV